MASNTRHGSHTCGFRTSAAALFEVSLLCPLPSLFRAAGSWGRGQLGIARRPNRRSRPRLTRLPRLRPPASSAEWWRRRAVPGSEWRRSPRISRRQLTAKHAKGHLRRSGGRRPGVRYRVRGLRHGAAPRREAQRLAAQRKPRLLAGTGCRASRLHRFARAGR